MEKEISIQIHDYDLAGRYVIIEDRKATLDEAHELKEKARKSVNAEWQKLPPEAAHIVYYAEMLDKDGEVWFAGIYMCGEAYNEAGFDRIFHRPNIGYVGAIHKRT
jgi:hypothetical protein